MYIRNTLFNINILPSKSYDFPVICIGNLSVGGTGKTPHIEYLVRLLKNDLKVATLSRGYKRKTKGFRFASEQSLAEEVGDEPLQIRKKFENIVVAVDANRQRGIELIKKQYPDTDVILLDDAFQHRRVDAGLKIILSDFHKLFTRNFPLPSGTLREFKSGAKRADIIIVTKTPKVFSPILRKILIEEIKPQPHQHLFFSYIKYGCITPLPGITEVPKLKKYYTLLMFTGIANTYPLQDHLNRSCAELISLNFPDHHSYTKKDLEYIRKKYTDIFSRKKAIITTEKDLMHLDKPGLIDIIKDLPVFYIPIEVSLHKNDREVFQKLILDYVSKDPKNS